MKVGRGRKAVSVVFVVSVTAGGLIALPPTVALAATSFTAAPERLYMAPEGTTLLAQLAGVPIAHMPFDGATDIISQDVRTISVDTPDGPLGCDTMTDKPVGVMDYDIDDCSRIQMDVGHGRMFMGTATQIFRDWTSDPDGPGGVNIGDPNPNDFEWRLPSGAIMDQFTGPGANEPDGHKLIHIVGTAQQLNDALAALVYTPDAGYYYVGSFNPETLHMVLVPGDPNETPPDPKDVQIRVLDVNDFPSHDGPDNKAADPQIELVMTDEFTAADEDNDEDVDGAQAEPPVAEDPLPDGENSAMLLVGWLTCGQAIAAGTGFHFGSSVFQLDDPSLDDLLRDVLQPAGAPSTYIDAALAALEAIKPGLSTLPFATSQPTTYTTAFGGISTMTEVQDALADVRFLHNAPNDTCTLVTVVSDLGNNGLPIQYVGSPPTGVEIPFIGFDWNVLTITTGALDEIHVNFDPTPLLFNEGDGPATAEAELHISPATHPEFTIKWDAVPRVTDPPPGPGVATPNDDFAGTFNNTLTVPANETVIPIQGQPLPSPVGTTVFDDPDDEGNETFQYVLDLSPSAPPGWIVKSETSSRTVVIIDDDDAPAELDSVSDPTIVEGDSGTKQLQFTLELNQPADGTEQVEVDTADGTATVADNDYAPLTDQVVTFDAGETTKLVNVTVNGDITDEPDESLTLGLSNANIALNDTSGTGTIQNDDDPRTVISVQGATVPEGNTPSTTPMTFNIVLDNPAKPGDTVQVTTSGATPGTDYVALTNLPVPLVPGATTTPVIVIVNGDNIIEANEQVTLTLSNPSPGVSINVSSGNGTIQNDDGIPSVAVDDVTVKEGDIPSTILASFTVSLTDPAIGGETITVDAANVNATEGVDFAPFAPQLLTFAAGETQQVVDVTVIGDNDAEPDELFVLNLSLPTGLLVADSAGVGTITNDDLLVSLSPSATAAEGDPAALTLTIEPATHPSFLLGYGTTGITATAGLDYTEQVGPLIVPVNAPTMPLSIPTLQDPRFEAPETLNAIISTLPPPPNFTVRIGGSPISTVTITDDDPAPLMSIANVNVVEGDTAQLTVTLANPSHNCTVDFDTDDGTATVAGNDYTANSGTAMLNGVPTATINVVTNNNPAIEVAETFTVTLSSPGGDIFCDVGNAVATVTIIDNDDPSPTLSIGDASITEGTGAGTTTISFDVTTSGVQPADCGYRVVLTHDASNGTSDADFSSPATFDQTASFLTTDVTVTRSFDVARDAVDESDETFTVTITGNGATPCAIGGGSATGTIIDDDDAPQDTTSPDVTVTLVGGNPTSSPSIDFTIQFTEDVTGFDAGDVDLGGTAGATNVSLATIDANTYTATVTGMSVSGTVTVSVEGNTAQDGAGNGNNDSNVASVQWNMPVPQDTLAPSVIVTPGVASPTSSSPIPFTIEFSEAVTGFVAADVVLTAPAGATLTLTPVDADTYTVSVGNLLASGTVSVSVPAGAAQDLAQNNSVASNTASVEFVLSQGPLMLNLPSNIVRNNDPGQAGAVVTFNASASGGAPPVVVVCAPASGAFFPLGTTTVSCTATDADEGIDQAIVSGTFTVQVVDNEPPTIADLPDLTRTTTDTTPVVVTFALPAASDNSGVAPTVVCTPLSGTAFPVGVGTVTCTATDGAGLTASSSFTVTVTSTPSAPPTPTPGALPPTGASSTDMVRLATILIAAGAALLLAAVRRRQSSRASA